MKRFLFAAYLFGFYSAVSAQTFPKELNLTTQNMIWRTATNEFWSFNGKTLQTFNSNSFKEIPEMKGEQPDLLSAAFLWTSQKGVLNSMGGRNEKGFPNSFHYQYSTAENTWKKLPLPKEINPDSKMCFWANETQLWVLVSDFNFQNPQKPQLWIWENEKWRKVEKLEGAYPSETSDASTWMGSDGQLYLYGGLIFDGKRYGKTDEFWCYSPAQNQWTLLNHKGLIGEHTTLFGAFHPDNWPGIRLKAATWTSPDGSLYLMGGKTQISEEQITFDTLIWQYSIDKKQWSIHIPETKAAILSATHSFPSDKGVLLFGARLLNADGSLKSSDSPLTLNLP
jgi:hypothetical protein